MHHGLKVLAFMMAVTNLCAQAQEGSTLKMRVLGPRSAGKNDSVVFEAAGSPERAKDNSASANSDVRTPTPGATRTPTNAALGKGDPTKLLVQPAHNQSAQSPRDKLQQPQSKPPADLTRMAQQKKAAPSSQDALREHQLAEAQSAGQRRIQALQRVNTLNQAAGPRDAGVPQRARPTTRDITASRPITPAAPQVAPPVPTTNAVAAIASAPANPVVQSIAPMPDSPVSSDPVASEIVRSGDFYTFTGTLNGIPVTFRINREITGVKIPTRLANLARIVPPEAKASLARLQEVVSPVNSIAFGAFPVKAVMAKIYLDQEEDQIDVGIDALNSFKIREQNGRRVLVRS